MGKQNLFICVFCNRRRKPTFTVKNCSRNRRKCSLNRKGKILKCVFYFLKTVTKIKMYGGKIKKKILTAQQVEESWRQAHKKKPPPAEGEEEGEEGEEEEDEDDE